VTSTQPRGIGSLIPTSRTQATPGELAAAQLLHLRSATVPVPVLAAAAALIAPQLEDADPATREAADAVHARLLAAIQDAAPDR
jgi:cysteine sulfinate desulfinase/cysteine desulfurase-like protein